MTTRPFVELSNAKLRIWPIIIAVIAIEPILMLGREPARWVWHHGPAEWADRAWIFVLLACIFQGVVGVLLILVMRRVLPQAEDNLRWPPGPSLAGLAFVIGIGMAVVMFVLDYWPLFASGNAPDGYSTNAIDALGWIVGIAAAPLGEETIFRGFMIGALSVLVPGRLRIGKVDLPLAAYIVAVAFALVHWRTFLESTLSMAIAQQAYAIAWGLVYAWLMERSRSLLAPMIAHATGNAFEVVAVIVWQAAAT